MFGGFSWDRCLGWTSQSDVEVRAVGGECEESQGAENYWYRAVFERVGFGRLGNSGRRFACGCSANGRVSGRCVEGGGMVCVLVL